jgi:hypothetical protein
MTRPKNRESTETKVRLQQAIAEYQKKKKAQKKVSLRRIAHDYKVNCQTLQNRLHGMQPRNKVQQHSMHLSNAEVKELVHWITTLTQRGYAPRYQTVQEMAYPLGMKLHSWDKLGNSGWAIGVEL